MPVVNENESPCVSGIAYRLPYDLPWLAFFNRSLGWREGLEGGDFASPCLCFRIFLLRDVAYSSAETGLARPVSASLASELLGGDLAAAGLESVFLRLMTLQR